MSTSHEEPGKNCHPNPPEDKNGARAPEGGVGSGTGVAILLHHCNLE